jgi:galactokinase/mevalonate kinase-like predicted kinase
MRAIAKSWDYLLVTASNDAQAQAYQSQLDVRQKLGLLAGARQVLVVADPQGKRVGSGGSTICCLLEVLNRELAGKTRSSNASAWRQTLQKLRILIVHAGGDSRRLPAYGPCGKIFVPVPGENDSAVARTLFDRQLPTYLDLPPAGNAGQIVITAGDALLSFDPAQVQWASEGLTGLGYPATPEQASRHGVFCADSDGRVRLFLQKPSPAQQARHGAMDRYGQTILDMGVMNFDADTAVALLKFCDAGSDSRGRLTWRGNVAETILRKGLDFYCEICCAMGAEATPKQHVAAAKAAGSKWDEPLLKRLYAALEGTPLSVRVLPQCSFLHFGTTRQIISSGIDLLRRDRSSAHVEGALSINNEFSDAGRISGRNSWVEGCRIRAPLTLAGDNVLVGAEVDEPLSLPAGACLDVLKVKTGNGKSAWFIRCYGAGDTFKDSVAAGATFCGWGVEGWLKSVGLSDGDVWDKSIPAASRSVWNARLFPAENSPAGFRRWLWMFDPTKASPVQHQLWRAARRYSLEEMAKLADQDDFHLRRRKIRADEIRKSLRSMFRLESGFSAKELALALSVADDPAAWVAQLLEEAHWQHGGENVALAAFAFSRILHTLGSAVEELAGENNPPISSILPGFSKAVRPLRRAWLRSLGLLGTDTQRARAWAQKLKATAFDQLSRTIVSSGARSQTHPMNGLRSDEIVWGRAPARLDLGGGWTDTPPYALEFGGRVINAAVNLNGQPPIQCYARVTEEPVIRIASIDLGMDVRISRLEELLDYRQATSGFAMAKAALALSGFSPEASNWRGRDTLKRMLELFGGGIELTTLAAIPKGSGLGTSSIMGAVILATVQRIMGRRLTPTELFHGVLRLEQALTTGGGWQDQIGGVIDGVKVITTQPGLVPEAGIHYVPPHVLDPRENGGCTLLYYTGLTRLAKNILQQVVGRYLNRDRQAMATLRQLHDLPTHVSAAMAQKDLADFGHCIDTAWRLNKQLDPDSSNDGIEALLARVNDHVYGAKLLGAGGGGFLLMVCRSPQDALAVRRLLDENPPNPRARFFDFDVSDTGLSVTVC